MNTKACKDCVYAEKQPLPPPNLHSIIVCRRFPPQMTQIPQPNGVASLVNFPMVKEDLWCWEYKQKLAMVVTKV